ncbi:MAG: FtsX-like permease family protein, partial [Acidobacteria bacterium]|nr:FtsX-like permease family protein [Acidobacteriota bacterium]
MTQSDGDHPARPRPPLRGAGPIGTSALVRRGLTYYWRTNLAVVAGVATAVAVLAGALLVGDSVRGSLRDLVVQRLGRADHVVVASGFFREAFSDRLASTEAFAATFTGAVPLIVVPGFVTDQESGRRVGQVRVYGVDDRFWHFHDVDAVAGPEDGEALLSPALAETLGTAQGGAVLVRVQRPSDFPLESVHGRKDDLGRTLRLTVRGVVATEHLGQFSLEAQQGEVRAAFVPLSQLQEELGVGSRANAILVAEAPGTVGGGVAALEALVRQEAALVDIGLDVRILPDRGVVSVGGETGLLDDTRAAVVAEAADDLGLQALPVFTYLANTLRLGDREIPYSLVTALDLDSLAPAVDGAVASALPLPDASSPIVLNQWAADELRAGTGDAVTMDYYLWEDPGQLVTRTAEFRVAGVVPVDAGDRNLVPSYPGISDALSLVDWDPPFPVDLSRIRPADEAYWDDYRTTPKAFISLADGQRLWRSRDGALTALRMVPGPGQSLDDARTAYADHLREIVDPLALGMAVRDVRAAGLAASRGATDFGAYFVYFSFFLVASALVLAALFFKLGVEQRSREVGLLRAVGFGPSDVRRLFLAEGVLLAIVGSAAGVLLAVGYAGLMMMGLRTWWVDAVGTDALTLHVSGISLAAGGLGGVATAVLCIWWTLRGLDTISERSLLAGELEPARLADASHRSGWLAGREAPVAAILALAGVALMAVSTAGLVAPTGAFFGGGTLLLASTLLVCAAALRRPVRNVLGGHGWWAVSRIGLRNTHHRPGRSVLSIAVIASATFLLISVDAFRRDGQADPGDRGSGLGGYALSIETLLPVVHDPNTQEGRDALNLFDLEASTFELFRLLPGDDASCLNLYAPTHPRILAPQDSFLAEGRFAFQDSLASTDAERANPWLLLLAEQPDGAVPVIADANSLAYALHRQLGEEMVVTQGGRDIRLRFVAALRDSIFQSEVLMSQANFTRLFPDQEGYQFLLAETTSERTMAVADQVEDALIDFGADVTTTAGRRAAFHRVENTYLSTFQTLGGLGLLLGTVGFAAVLLRNALERRRELALLGAIGYQRRHFLLMAVSENTLLLAAGLAAGALCAALAIAP